MKFKFLGLFFLLVSTETLASGGVRSCNFYLDSQSTQNLDLSSSQTIKSRLNNIESEVELSLYLKTVIRKSRSIRGAARIRFLKYGSDLLLEKIERYSSQLDNRELLEVFEFFEAYRFRKITPKFLKNIESTLVERIEEFSLNEMSAIILHFGRLRVRPSTVFLVNLQNHIRLGNSEITSTHLTSLIQGFGLMNHAPEKMFMVWWRRNYSILRLDFKLQQLSNSMFGFYLLRQWSDIKFVSTSLAPKVWRSYLFTNDNESSVAAKQIALIDQYFRAVFDSPIPNLPESLFNNLFATLNKKPRSAETSLETQVGGYLAMDGIKFVTEYKTKAGFYVDFYVPNENRVIQADGPTHYIKTVVDGVIVEEQRPQDGLMDDVLRALGYSVDRKNYNNYE